MRRRTGRTVLIIMTLCLLSMLPVQAQQNLLQNPGFEDDYSGRMGRGDFTFPAFWEAWFTESPRTEAWMNVPPTGYPHNGPFRRSGNTAQSIAKGGGSFTAAAFQRVQNIPAGAIVRGTAYVYLENNEGTNAQVRIGIGSNVGTDVNGAITWSDWEKRLNGLHQIAVEHVALGGEVTLFIYTTQTWPNDPNALYIDDAELIIVGEGEVPAETGGDTNPVVVQEVSRPSGVPFVSPQNQNDGGEVVHVVGSGDTIAAISVAYGVKIDEILAMNGLDRQSILQVGQRLVIKNAGSSPPPQDNTEETNTTEDAAEPAATEEAVEAVEVAATPVEAPPPVDTQQGETLLSVSMITQNAESVAIAKGEGDNTLNLTFGDNQFRMLQVMPEFIGVEMPLDFWIEFWGVVPGFVVDDVMLIVSNRTIMLSISGLSYNETDNTITYSAVAESMINAQGEVLDIATIPEGIAINPVVYFRPDAEFLDTLSRVSNLLSPDTGSWLWCTWIQC